MESFSRRPLTWLFFAALACLDAVALARDPSREWLWALVKAQTCIIGAWAAMSSQHRLARAGWLVAGIAADWATLLLLEPQSTRHRDALAFVALLCGATFAAAYAVRQVLEMLPRAQRVHMPARLRFPVVELFGWTIVVAIASAGAGYANYAFLLNDVGERAQLFVGPVAGLIAGLYLSPERCYDRIATVAATTAACLAVFVLPRFVEFDAQDVESAPVALAVIGYWILVQRLDDHAARQRGCLAAAVEA